MNPAWLVSSGLLGCGVSLFLVWLILKLGDHREGMGQARDMHHTHHAPVPRLGGVALAVAFLAVVLFAMLARPGDRFLGAEGVLLAGGMAMFLLGLWDDLKPTSARKKFLGQVLIAAAVYYAGIGIEEFKNPLTGTTIHFGPWCGVITVLWIVGITNLINLIDGADGLAGGISLMLMLLLAYVAYQMQGLALIACGMAGALIGFLWFNFPPARIYMGDGGAYLLGFLISTLSIVSSQKGTIAAALLAPLFVLTLPIVDTVLAVLRRGLRGLPIFRPDRKHIHHKLARSGFSQRRVVLSIYVLTLVFLVMALGVFWSQGRLLPILLGSLFMILLFCAGAMNFSREWFAVGRVVGHSLEMRQEIQYALSLSRWLELHSLRTDSIEQLWSDFLFFPQKLGFGYVRLTLEDGEKEWRAEGFPRPDQPCHRARHELKGGELGTLELAACRCPVDSPLPKPDCTLRPAGKAVCPCVANATLFEILSELAAEAWLKAATRWQQRNGLPVRFTSKVGTAFLKRVNGSKGLSLFRLRRARET